MLTEICGHLNNWFMYRHCFGTFTITDDIITYADGTRLPIMDGQLFCVKGSVFNDGIHIFVSSLEVLDEPMVEKSALVLPLHNETFTGSVICMAVPQDVIELAGKIKEWNEKNGSIDSPAKSPFNSESYAGYSYSKNNESSDWKNVFAAELRRYKKLPL